MQKGFFGNEILFSGRKVVSSVEPWGLACVSFKVLLYPHTVHNQARYVRGSKLGSGVTDWCVWPAMDRNSFHIYIHHADCNGAYIHTNNEYLIAVQMIPIVSPPGCTAGAELLARQHCGLHRLCLSSIIVCVFLKISHICCCVAHIGWYRLGIGEVWMRYYWGIYVA